MTVFISIALLIISSTATLAAFGGDTWAKGPEPVLQRIKPRGWISLICLTLSLILGIIQALRTQKLEAQKAADEAKLIQAALEEDRLRHEPLSPAITEWGALDDANQAFTAGHTEEALAKITEAISQMNKGGDTIPGVREKAYLSRAEFNLKLQNYQDVVHDCEEVANDNLSPDMQALRHNFEGKALESLHHSEEALKHFGACIQLHPAFEIACYRGAVISNFSLKDYQAALDVANEGLGKQGNDELLLKARSAALLALGNDKNASSPNINAAGSSNPH